jgi:hypothetical protein
MTTVRAHARRGTRGVRRHLRIVPAKNAPFNTVRLHPRGKDADFDAYVQENVATAYSVMPTANRGLQDIVPGGNIYLAKDPASELRLMRDRGTPNSDISTEEVTPAFLSHEVLHFVLHHEVNDKASEMMDTPWRRTKRREGYYHGGI